MPTFSFIAPSQCNDQHGRGNAGPFCHWDPKSDGSQAGLNPALIQRGDVAVKKIVTAIRTTPVCREGRDAIVILWDENHYSIAPNTNQVPLFAVTNYGKSSVKSATFYDHSSLLKSIEPGPGPALFEPCLR